MIKADDCSLDPSALRSVEERARALLNRAEVWDRFPTPIEDILAAANLRVEKKCLQDADGFMAYLAGKAAHIATKAAETLSAVKSALTKVFGIYDPGDSIIHIDDTVSGSKQNFLKLHETGHHELPAHRKMFRFFQDCEQTLAPEVADLFEREANNFARFALFQGGAFSAMAADCPLLIKTPMKLATKFGASIYASAREFARTNHRDCLVVVLNRAEYINGAGMRASVRRIEPSPSFRAKFPIPTDEWITLDHPLGRLLPRHGQRMVKPTSLAMRDLNGQRQECIAESFDTTHNIIILLYPQKALTTTTVILPAGFKQAGNF
ncbi:MAG: ImmA/IrrE family metallo-endopeptidase [Hyphomicrobium sp.]|uniref:ImmA/IrrE family metallo-endopeptidase n=1 Tax=Hyphomicrobium sp. TaxID=82 RepID=UPI0025C078C5|nr:ImmA/IrrE family metallo-endopeptidase [Hyphomicrobium sp.]MBX9863148.1 ImmA/IrrE family metallo-endopeptidase [Hyphomicrobium sp.]